MWEHIETMSDAGCVAVTDGNLRVDFNNGFGDGPCEVLVGRDASEKELPYAPQLIGSFVVSESASVLGYDCDEPDVPGVYDLDPGFWFVYNAAPRVYDEAEKKYVLNHDMPDHGFVAFLLVDGA